MTRSFHQPDHGAQTTDATAVQVEAAEWTTIGQPEAYRLQPGEYCEVHAPGIAIAPRNDHVEDWSNVRAGSWILAEEGDEILFQPGPVMLTGDHAQRVGPVWWQKFVEERLDRESPLPADPKEREVILFRVVQDLFGTSPSPEEADEFLKDPSPDALDRLAAQLLTRTWLTTVAGPIHGATTKFKVLPETTDTETRPRIALSPGRYNLGDDIRLVVARRGHGERIVSEAALVWFPKGGAAVPNRIDLPEEDGSWAAAWAPHSTVLWVAEKGLLRSFDFTDPGSLVIESFAGRQTDTAPISPDVRASLSDALQSLERGAAPDSRPAPAASASP